LRARYRLAPARLLPARTDTRRHPRLLAEPAIRFRSSPGIKRCAGNKPTAIDLLLDVELPVSVSFGRAQLPLKDVIKLTTGSIVELNRAVSEPVDVIVNNCVIARGEVVVEGNFGVRELQELRSRVTGLDFTRTAGRHGHYARKVQGLSRRGEPVETIAATLGLPRREVELLLKVHQVSLASVGAPTTS